MGVAESSRGPSTVLRAPSPATFEFPRVGRVECGEEGGGWRVLEARDIVDGPTVRILADNRGGFLVRVRYPTNAKLVCERALPDGARPGWVAGVMFCRRLVCGVGRGRWRCVSTSRVWPRPGWRIPHCANRSRDLAPI